MNRLFAPARSHFVSKHPATLSTLWVSLGTWVLFSGPLVRGVCIIASNGDRTGASPFAVVAVESDSSAFHAWLACMGIFVARNCECTLPQYAPQPMRRFSAKGDVN